ncbi:MAG: DM13 domain-containing protein [Timaviella obliquedivisa GSE-PSE-MK23-08B]|jgi:hypothetical protein|nr:DM13 domain-containing protein [Timaviella obliquedivisa GSE-PSE-MK23-08B]
MMTLKYLTLGAIVAVATLTIACTRNEAALQPTEAVTPSSVISNPTQPQIFAASPVAQSGQFVASEHPTEGTARIVTENGKRYLVFDQAFKSDEGPDLFVLLHRDQMPQTYDAQNYISLGRLQSVKGEQRYAIPDDVDLANFQSAVIWCRQFNATFGYAPFTSL